jgi:hypothetical protein
VDEEAIVQRLRILRRSAHDLRACKMSTVISSLPNKAFKACVLAVVLLLSVLPSVAQLDVVTVFGTVKDNLSAKKLEGVTITVYKNGAKLLEVQTNASGKYEVNLDYGSDYKVMCAKTGFVGKNITIDTRNVPEEDRAGGHGMNIDFTMMVEIKGVDYSILNEPFGKAKFVGAAGNFEWDMEYTARMRDAQARLMKEYEERKKREANAEAEYAKAIQAGNTAMTVSDYNKAVEQFTVALEFKANDPVATAKLSDAKMRMEGADADKKANEQYAALVKEADALFAKKDYAGAKTKYDAALDVKDKEPYPKQKLNEIEGLLAEAAKKAEEERKAKELNEKYQAAITAADAAFKAGNLDQATTKYTEAGTLKAEEKYPKDQLAAIALKRDELAKKAEEERKAKELNEKYQAAVTAGDVAFKAANWDLATTKFTEASTLKPEEKYPKDQLAAIALKKDEAAKKADEERKAKELNEKYLAAIAIADQAFNGARYEEATAKYTEASTLKTEEKYPKDRLALIQVKLAELAKKADEEQQAKDLEERYKGLLSEAMEASSGERLDDAIAKYTEASALKPKEQYPKDQIAALNKRKADLAKKAEEEQKAKELNDKYLAVVAAADEAFGKEDWELATAKYTEAGGLKPAEKYPKDQLTAIAQRKADAETRRKQEELDGKYQAAISAADAAFDKQEFPTAKAKYQEALALKAQEKYPKDRIAEVDARVAEAARKAEEERKAKELDDRYKALVAKADAAFAGQKLSEALNDYKDASGLKPQETHPKERIAIIESQLDAAAKAKAEEERLAREAQDRDKRYGDLIVSADKAFGAKQYDKARDDYSAALAVKPAEQHPKDRLDEIENLLAEQARKAAADKEAAERDAAEKARKAEADRLAAELAAAEKARLAEEERMRNAAAAEVDARYRELIAAGDIAFTSGEWETAREKYNAALGVKPEEKYPKDKLASIDGEIARRKKAEEDAARMSEEQRRLEEERRLKAAQDAEASRLAAEADRQRLEEERLRREREAELAKQSSEERERAERERIKALEESYRSAILGADEALAAGQHQQARGLYAQASDLKPQEVYPISKIEQIDKYLVEQERQRAEAELAARQRQEQTDTPQRTNSTIDLRKEEEAERFMREAREREEAEKYERIRKFRSDLEAKETASAEAAGQRRMEGVERKQQVQEQAAGLYQGNEGRRQQNAEALEAQREALARAEAERQQRAAQTRGLTYEGQQAMQAQRDERARSMDEQHAGRAQEVAQTTEAVRSTQARQSEAGRTRTEQARAEVEAQAAATAEQQQRGATLQESGRQAVEDEKRAQQAREARYAQASAENRALVKAQLESTPKDQPRAFADYNRSKLAQDYPPGVTEESYTEGNKVIIRRVVVNGNKADEYSKVIAKWGTFYFKNGQSITEAIWAKETEG